MKITPSKNQYQSAIDPIGAPFGTALYGRVFSAEKYSYGFGGQEKDDEIKGTGNSYTAEFWEYDSRLGRRWNLDPVIKEWESPYATFSNNPIYFADPSGADDGSSTSGPDDQCQVGESNSQGLTMTDYSNQGGSTTSGYSKSTEGEPSPTPNTGAQQTPATPATLGNADNASKDVSELSLSSNGLNLLKKEEGFVDHVYNDAGGANTNYYTEKSHIYKDNKGVYKTGNPTVGYGTLLTQQQVNADAYKAGITEAQAAILLCDRVQTAENAVKSAVLVHMTPYQFDAVVIFTYNVGEGSSASHQGLRGSDFLIELNKSCYSAQLMDHYHTPESLIMRRDDEINLFNTGHYVFRVFKYDNNYKKIVH